MKRLVATLALALGLLAQTPIPVTMYSASPLVTKLSAPLTADTDDDEGAADTFVNVGPVGQWVAGQIVFANDNVARFGGEIPPGVTGAGAPDSGIFMASSLKNSLLYTDLGAVGWTETDGGGAAVVSAAATSPYADSRAVTHLLDDRNDTVEFVTSSAIDISAQGTGHHIQITIAARDATGTVLDGKVVESGVCAGGTYALAAKTIDTTWKRYTWDYVLADGDCTTATLALAPADMAAVENMGGADVGAVGVWVGTALGGQPWAPIFECATGAAAVTCGDDYLYFATTNVVDVNGTLNLPTTIAFNYTGGHSLTSTGVQYFLYIEDTATADDLWQLVALSDTSLYLYVSSTEEGAARIVGLWNSVTLTAGTTYAMRFQLGSTPATTRLWIDGVPKTNSSVTSIAALPNSLDTIEIGSKNGTGQVNGWISDLVISQP